jgi:hypothetical protein
MAPQTGRGLTQGRPRIGEFEGVEEECVYETGSLVWEGAPGGAEDHKGGTGSPERPGEEQPPEVQRGRKEEWNQPEPEESDLHTQYTPRSMAVESAGKAQTISQPSRVDCQSRTEPPQA